MVVLRPSRRQRQGVAAVLYSAALGYCQCSWQLWQLPAMLPSLPILTKVTSSLVSFFHGRVLLSLTFNRYTLKKDAGGKQGEWYIIKRTDGYLIGWQFYLINQMSYFPNKMFKEPSLQWATGFVHLNCCWLPYLKVVSLLPCSLLFPWTLYCPCT